MLILMLSQRPDSCGAEEQGLPEVGQNLTKLSPKIIELWDNST